MKSIFLSAANAYTGTLKFTHRAGNRIHTQVYRLTHSGHSCTIYAA